MTHGSPTVWHQERLWVVDPKVLCRVWFSEPGEVAFSEDGWLDVEPPTMSGLVEPVLGLRSLGPDRMLLWKARRAWVLEGSGPASWALKELEP